MTTTISTPKDAATISALYNKYRQKYPERILLFEFGESFEAYFDDAAIVANTLDLVPTTREGVSMTAFPAYAFVVYLPALIAAGYSSVMIDNPII